MTITEAVAKIGVEAIFTPVNDELASRPIRVGSGSLERSWSDADTVYGFKVAATLAANVATLTLSSGAVVQTTGTPTISRAGGDGEDAEGETLPTLATVYAVQIRSTGTGYMAVASSLAGMPDVTELNDGDDVVFTSTSGLAAGAGTLAVTAELATSECEIIVIGKS